MARRRRKRNPAEWGLITRVAVITGKSLSLVSMVNSGKAVSRKVSEALERERAVMRNEYAANKTDDAPHRPDVSTDLGIAG